MATNLPRCPSKTSTAFRGLHDRHAGHQQRVRGRSLEPGELQGQGWEPGRVLRDCARCWENVLGSPEEGLGEGKGLRGGGGRPGESQSLDRDTRGAAGRGSHTRTTDSTHAAARGTHRPIPTRHPRPGVSSLARPACQVLVGPLKAQAPQTQRAG